MRNILRISGVIFALVMLISACSKKSTVEDKIIGSWQQISVGQEDLKNNTVKWTFHSGNKLFIQHFNQSNLLSSDTANWEIKTKFAGRNNLVISGMDKSFGGTYTIIKLKDDFFTLQRLKLEEDDDSGSPYLWLEFQKK